jgi:hypothetical protein
MQKYVSHMEQNSRLSSFDRVRNPTPPLSRSMTLQRENGDSGAKRVLCAAVCELDYLMDVRRVTKDAHIEHL